MSINAINTQLLAIKQAKTNIKTDVSQNEKEARTTTNTSTPQKQMNADDVFKYMSATSTMPVQLKKTVNVKAYVDEKSASIISSSIKSFEEQYMAKLNSVKSEFGNISDELAEKITLSMF